MTTSGSVHDELQGFGLEARRAVVAAQDAARSLAHERVGTEHLLLGLLADAGTGSVLRDAGITDGSARRKVIEAVPAGAPGDGSPLPRTARCSRALGRAARFARDDHADAVGCNHLLLGVLDVEGTAGQVLRGLGVDVEQLRSAIARPAATAVADGEPAGAIAVDAAAPPPPVRCPRCDAPLTDGVTATRLPLHGEGGARRTVLAVSCPACGTLLGTAPG